MQSKAKIDVRLVMPNLPDLRDSCIQRLTAVLMKKDGIGLAHLIDGEGSQVGQICIHYDEAKYTLLEIRDAVKRAGADLDSRYGHLLLSTEAMPARNARTLEQRVRALPGVLDVAASPAGAIRIEFDRTATDESKIRTFVEKAASSQSESACGESAAQGESKQSHGCNAGHAHGGMLGERTELIFAAVCGALLLIGWLLSTFLTVSPWLPWSLYLAAYAFGGFFTFREAVGNLRALRFEIDSLMLIAAVGAAALGEWAEGALLLFLFSLGHALEHYAMGRAKRAIEALAELAPQSAVVRREGSTSEVPVAELRIGDVVLVKPNERLAADGFVLKGESAVNQAPITGESVPIDKRPVPDSGKAATGFDKLGAEFRVYAGSINGSGAIEVQVMKLAGESTLARVAKMVQEAETQKSPTQRFTDRFERIFVPLVLTLGVVLLFAWLVVDEPIRESFYRAMAVLVAASPCALAISTPSAVLSGIARAARSGVLVKGGGPLENLGQLETIAFDKTGTLTEGRPRLTDVIATSGRLEADLLKVAVAVEKLSDHPLADAVVSGAADRLKEGSDLQAHDMRSITGHGVRASVDGETVYIGKERLFAEVEGRKLTDEIQNAVGKLKESGRTIMIVRRGEEYLGVLGLMDTPRVSATEIVGHLKKLGIRKTIMLSGDNQQVADAVAKQVGITEALGDLMPEDKVSVIQKLSDQGGIAMVGDGVNDAPAMANASVGIAMGAAGSHVALETADVALMADDLSKLPFAVGLSRKTSRIIRQNLWFSLGVVAFLIPATILGLKMGAAVMLHEGSTLLVVINALRLLNYRES